MEDYFYLFYVLLFLVAFLFASVGHGGASGYIALMVIYGISPEIIRPTSLILNIFVSSVSFFQFYRGGHFKTKLFLPFAIGSIPFSFIGGMISIDGNVYKKILGVLLLFAVIRILFFQNTKNEENKVADFYGSLFIGSIIGLFSGMIGIGGGIVLSPLLLLLKWTNQKQTAAISALFILVNSVSGFTGQLIQGIHFSTDMYFYVLTAFSGGLIGAYLGALKFNHHILKNILAFVLVVASFKLLFS